MPTQMEAANLATDLRYIKLVEEFAEPDAFAAVLHPKIRHQEFPNLLMKNGSQRGYATLVVGPQQGRKILRDNRYEITNSFAGGDWVTLEIVWTGTLAIPLGAMNPGDGLKAYIATILQFQDGKIFARRQYDCYEPFPVATGS
jgi:hypothetical protein